MIDEFTRECIALEVNRRFTGESLVYLLRDLFVARGVPEFIRSDNGPEFVSRSVREFLNFIEVGASLHRARQSLAKRLRRKFPQPPAG